MVIIALQNKAKETRLLLSDNANEKAKTQYGGGSVISSVWKQKRPPGGVPAAFLSAFIQAGTPDGTRTHASGSGGRRSIQLSYGGTDWKNES